VERPYGPRPPATVRTLACPPRILLWKKKIEYPIKFHWFDSILMGRIRVRHGWKNEALSEFKKH